MKIALLTTDNREHYRDYQSKTPYFGTAPEGLLQGMVTLPDLEVHVISCLQEEVESPEKLGANIWYHALRVSKIGWLRTGYQGCIRAVGKKLAELQPDVVHAQGTERDCALSAVFSPYPKVLTIHGNMRLIAKMFHAPLWSSLGLTAKSEAFCLPRFDGVVCISRYTENAIRVLAKKTWLLPNAADETFFNIERQPSFPVVEIIYVGTVDERKNQNAFIEAVAPLAEEFDFHLRFFGVHSPSAFGLEFDALLAKHPWCSYEGLLNREQLRGWFARASLLVLASHEDNCPMTVLEAAASGVPILASRVGGIPDLVEDGVNGVLCDPASSKSMRDGLRKLLADSAWRTELAARAKTSAMKRFHPTEVAARHLEIYREVLQNTNRRKPGAIDH